MDLLDQIFDEIMASPLGAQINSDACEKTEHYIILLHCWDGRRYRLSCNQEKNGCAYDAKTGASIQE